MAEMERSLGDVLFLLPKQCNGFNMLDSHQPYLEMYEKSELSETREMNLTG